MNRPRRVRSPPFGYDPRVMGRTDPRAPPPDYDEPYTPATPFDSSQSSAAFMEPPHPSPHYSRDHRLPSAYRATLREPYIMSTSSAPYKILCITNINPKVSDGPVKDALLSDFRRFGEISVSVCHDSGERLAYIYFRTYEEAREARHSKSRTLLFDRPIDIEPIFDPSSSPVDTSPPQSQPAPVPPQPSSQTQPPQIYSRRRTPTPPPEYYPMNGPAGRRPPQAMSPSQQIPPHHSAGSPSLNYPHLQSSSYPHTHSPPAPMHYNRYYMSPAAHLPPPSPYSSPPHEQYRSYHPHPTQIPPDIYQPGHPAYPPSPYGPPSSVQLGRDRERPTMDAHIARSPSRHDPYYQVDHHHHHHHHQPHHRPYPPQPLPAQHSSRVSSSLHSSSNHHHHHHPSNLPSSIHSHSHPHPHPHPHPNPHHHHQTSAFGRRLPPHSDHPRYMSREFRREKYGSENYSNEPEEGRPSRVLFVSNIDPTKTEDELREIFSPFGNIEELELRKIGPNSSSALIKFSSMDCAYKAKTVTLGKYIGKSKCRIAYSRVSASRRLWIGGLGPTTTVSCLEEQFGKFGTITNLDYISGRPYAYVEFETTNQAQFATHHLRGTMVAEAEKRLRIEYVDPVDRNEKSGKADQTQNSFTSLKFRTANESWPSGNEQDESLQPANRKRSITPADVDIKRTPHTPGATFGNEHRSNVNLLSARTIQRSRSRSPIENNNKLTVSERNELNNNQNTDDRDDNLTAINNSGLESDNSVEPPDIDSLASAKSIREIVNICSASWSSQLVLRNFNFPSKMFMCSGRKATIDKYLNNLNGENSDDQCPILKITQRWRLHPQPKLEEVKRQMQSGNLGMLIITSRPDQSPVLSSPNCRTSQSSCGQSSKQNGDTNEESIDNDINKSTASGESSVTQSRPLKNLISYLEQKDAAGVISLNTYDRNLTDGAKLLYTFPPGDFALNLLKRKAPNLTPESTREEFLLGVIVGGAEAKI